MKNISNKTSKTTIIVITLLLSVYQCIAQSLPDQQIVEVDTIGESVFSSRLEDLSNQLLQSQITFTYNYTYRNKYGFSTDEIPTWSDSAYISRFNQLDAATPIELKYNKIVKDYINLYANKNRKYTEKLLGLSYLYFPIIEEMLDKYQLPLELKYMCVVESGLNPTVGSYAGAKGLWQFMYGTAKLYGLSITSYIDERLDLYKSTDAACRHFRDLYEIYGDWLLVIAAYNSGTGNINKAIRRSGGKADYWQIYPYLSQETRSYVPAFSAVLYVMNYPIEHNLYPDMPVITNFDTDTLMIDRSLSFEQIHDFAGTSIKDISYLNPQYKQKLIPATNGKLYSIILPTKNIMTFITNSKKSSYSNLKKPIVDIPTLQNDVYVVKQGDCLSKIASKFDITVKQIISWNNLKSNDLKIGQKLIVTKPDI